MAIDILSIPAMSSEPERVFSRLVVVKIVSWNIVLIKLYTSSKLLLSNCQNRLGDDIIEACECVKAWEREGFLIDDEIMAVETMLNDLEEVSYS